MSADDDSFATLGTVDSQGFIATKKRLESVSVTYLILVFDSVDTGSVLAGK